jgi:L-aspartate oxidase
VLTKDLAGGASPLAQGGLAAAIGPGDSTLAHARDTVIAGAGQCDAEVGAALTAGAPGVIDWLVDSRARLEQADLRLEGGHSKRRIVHSGDDASGAEVHRAVLAALLTLVDAGRIEVLDRAVALDLIAGGLRAAIIRGDSTLAPGTVSAPAVVLAAGGLGQAFATTSNPAGATGDAIAIAARAGAVLRDLEFVQFHPTVLWSADGTGQRPLITEALRGAGAVIRDLDGRPVMAGRHPLADLAPRDVVAAAMHQVIDADQIAGRGSEHGGGHLWLDATGVGRHELEAGFPTVTLACRKEGIDPVTDLIPVAPGAHYSCGGIAAGLDGRTSIPGLYAIGEAASTGVHGANRLASNSLVEAVLMGRSVIESVIADARAREGASTAGAGTVAGSVTGAAAASRPVLAAAMSRYAGVVRDHDGLSALLRAVADVPAEPNTQRRLDLGCVEATSLHTVSVLIAVAALERTESRGAHRRRDFPDTWQQARHTLLQCAPDGTVKVGS